MWILGLKGLIIIKFIIMRIFRELLDLVERKAHLEFRDLL